jgi:hypothetical protein
MSIKKELFVITRICKICKKQKPLRGSTTYPKFMCAECKKLKKEEPKS